MKVVKPTPTLPLSGQSQKDDEFDSDEDMEYDHLQSTKRASVVTPGELITDDTQYMRGHGTYQLANSIAMHASVFGTIERTNKLITVHALRARYVPEIGNLVVGRIVEVQTSRWKVDIGAPSLAQLPLTSINLPGGVQRKRNALDEKNIRTYFSEGDLLVAEVQALHKQGSCTLHTRSIKYGKLRNGFFMSTTGAGGGVNKARQGGVALGRRQIFTITTAHGHGPVDIILGVNGYIWISKHVEAQKEVGINRLEEVVSQEMFSSQNDTISVETRQEITRIACCIRSLIEAGKSVEEDMIIKAYEDSLDPDDEHENKNITDYEEEYLAGALG